MRTAAREFYGCSYLAWMVYDNNMNLIEQGSGVRRVTNPNSFEQLLRDEIPIAADGYLHAYVSNGSVSHVSFDNFMLTYLRGNTRQINYYYPYGLSIDGLDHSDEYLNKYTSKELQTWEFSFKTTEGLEMFDYSRSCLFFKGAHDESYPVFVVFKTRDFQSFLMLSMFMSCWNVGISFLRYPYFNANLVGGL